MLRSSGSETMGQGPSREASIRSETQHIPHFLCNIKVHYLTHKSASLDSVVSQMKPAHIPSSYFF